MTGGSKGEDTQNEGPCRATAGLALTPRRLHEARPSAHPSGCLDTDTAATLTSGGLSSQSCLDQSTVDVWMEIGVGLICQDFCFMLNYLPKASGWSLYCKDPATYPREESRLWKSCDRCWWCSARYKLFYHFLSTLLIE